MLTPYIAICERIAAQAPRAQAFDIVERGYMPKEDDRLLDSRDQLDRVGWGSQGDAPVWTVGYYVDGTWRQTPRVRKSELIAYYFPRIEALDSTPFVTRERALLWAKVLPGAY